MDEYRSARCDSMSETYFVTFFDKKVKRKIFPIITIDTKNQTRLNCGAWLLG